MDSFPCDFCGAPLPLEKSKRLGHDLTHVRQIGQAAARDPATQAPASPSDNDLLRGSEVHRVISALGELASRQEGRDAGSSAELRRLELELIRKDQEIAQIKSEARFDELKRDIMMKTAPAQIPVARAENGSGMDVIKAFSEGFGRAIEIFKSTQSATPNPIEFARAYNQDVRENAKALGEFNEFALKGKELDVRGAIFDKQLAREDRRDTEHREAAAAEVRYQAQKFEHLTSLAQDAFRSMVAPVTNAVGKGVEQFVANRTGMPLPPIPPGGPFPPSTVPVPYAPPPAPSSPGYSGGNLPAP